MDINFIAEYLRLTETAESPTSYLMWGAISCLSATLRDNVYFSMMGRYEKIYPNMYILVLGESAVRKGTPFLVNKRILRGENGVNNTKVMTGSATMQAVLRNLALTENGQPMGGSGIMIASEAGGFFINDPQTIPILTDIYEFHQLYDKHVISYDIPPIKNLCLSMFAGTNEVMFEKMLDRTAREGGLLGRCVVIKESKRRKKDSGFELDVKYPEEEEYQNLVKYLKKLGQIKGPLKLSKDARDRYHSWYHDTEIEEFKTKTGYEGRMGTHVLKLSTALSAATLAFESREIQLPEMDIAINTCMNLLSQYKKMTYGTGIAPDQEFGVKITSQLLHAKDFYLTQAKLLCDLHGDLTLEILNKQVLDLEAKGFLQVKTQNGLPGYQLTERFIEMFKNKYSQRDKGKGHSAD